MRPDELWRTTPAELQALADGYAQRDQHEYERVAWAVANLINIQLPRGKQIQPMDLLRRKKSRAEREADFEQVWKKRGGARHGNAG